MKRILVAAVAAMSLGGAAQAASVVNGGFEMDPGVAGAKGNDFAAMPGASGGASWDTWSALPGWSTIDNGVEVQTVNTVGPAGFGPNGGDYYVELDTSANSNMFQDIMFDVGSYVLSFFYSPRENIAFTSNGIDYTIGQPGPGGIGVLFGSVTGPQAGPPATSYGTWTEITALFDIDVAGIYRLSFNADGTSDSFGGFIDDVQIDTVPLPASALLLLGGLGGLAAMRKRRKS